MLKNVGLMSFNSTSAEDDPRAMDAADILVSLAHSTSTTPTTEFKAFECVNKAMINTHHQAQHQYNPLHTQHQQQQQQQQQHQQSTHLTNNCIEIVSLYL